MTREEHHALGKQYRDQAIQAIRKFQETLNMADFEEYKQNTKLANKHDGIASAMFTRQMNKYKNPA